MHPLIKQFNSKIKAIKLGLKSIHSTDTFIISYPKSGNTWIRFIIANMLSDELINMKNINNYVPGIYGFKDKINLMLEPRFIKSHHSSFDLFPKSIYIYRDYRDIIVSYYHFQKDLGNFNGSISNFIKNSQLKTFGNWKDHITSALHFQKSQPEKILLLSYESMLKAPIKSIAKIAKFCNITPVKDLNKVSELCSFSSLRETEQIYGRVFNTPELTFFRSGQSGQWKNELSKEDVNFILAENGDLLSQLGYEI
jgi:hypothetical protein